MGELRTLEQAFNVMAQAVCARDRQIREHADAKLVRSAHLASLGKMAASIAHEVNNPITGIIIYLRMLRRRLQQERLTSRDLSAMTEWVVAIEEEAARCGRLISGMLQLGREPLTKIDKHDVNGIAGKSVALLEHRFVLGNVRVLRSLAGDLPLVDCDAEQIQQTLFGLLINAFEAMPGGGTVTIGTRRAASGDAVELVVEDSGVGIPAEHLTRIFDGFFTTKKDGRGLGLGLSIAQAIVRRHHGEISAESTVGRGSKFTIRLPLKQSVRDSSGVDCAAGAVSA